MRHSPLYSLIVTNRYFDVRTAYASQRDVGQAHLITVVALSDPINFHPKDFRKQLDAMKVHDAIIIPYNGTDELLVVVREK